MRECKSRIMVYLQNILSPKKPNQSKNYITDGLTTQIIKKNKEPSLVTKKKKAIWKRHSVFQPIFSLVIGDE